MVVAAFYLYLRPGLPPVEALLDTQLQTPMRIYSSDNKLIAEFGEKRREPIEVGEIPQKQIQALLAAEDARFFEHFGVDIKGLTRAALELVTTGRIQSGGSTITMQVAKNYFLSRDRTFIRKFNEILLAIQIERELSKEQILELYLNKIYLGNRAYGIGAAARVYYDRPVSELTIAQMATLAGLPKAPSAFNPLANPERAMIRRNWILGRMLDLGYITPEEYDTAIAEPSSARYYAATTAVDGDYVAEMARAELVRRYGTGVYEDGYQVFLTVSSERQQAATDALRAGLEAYDHRHGYRGPAGEIDLESVSDTAGRLEALGQYPNAGPLRAAVVTKVDDGAGKASVQIRGLGEGEISFESMAWASAYISERRTGEEPEKVSDVISTGDVIYVKPPQLARPEAEIEESGDIESIDLAESENSTTENATTEAQPEPATIIEAEFAQLPAAQGAIISLDPQTGAIQALSGGYSFSQNKYNRATQARRQPGSTFKPFLYLSALEKGFSPASVINDAPIVFDDAELEGAWRPQNSSGKFYGPTRLREALYRSRNLVSIRLLREIGIDYTLSYLDKLKIDRSAMPQNLSLALGSGLLSPMELARGFAVIANGGYDVQPYLIDRIESATGKTLYLADKVRLCDTDCPEDAPATTETESPEDTEDRQVVANQLPEVTERQVSYRQRLADERSVYLMHSMLRDVIARGTGYKARALGRDDIAGKTGTTNDQVDAWFAGFNPQITTTVWVGFDQPKSLGSREYGAVAALPIWMDYMKVALEDQPEDLMSQPNGLVSVRIDPDTGERARPGQSGAIFELFREEQVPPVTAQFGSDGSPASEDDEEALPQQLF